MEKNFPGPSFVVPIFIFGPKISQILIQFNLFRRNKLFIFFFCLLFLHQMNGSVSDKLSSITSIIQNRKSEILQMNAYLMSSPSDGITFQQRSISFLIIPHFPEFGLTLFNVSSLLIFAFFHFFIFFPNLFYILFFVFFDLILLCFLLLLFVFFYNLLVYFINTVFMRYAFY
jgi:hypothetical protein